MTVYQIGQPYPLFNDVNGDPLDNGFIYIGEEGKDPTAYPIQVYWDEDLTIPALQPLQTLNGYIVRNGTPSKVFTVDNFSILIRNAYGVIVAYSTVGFSLISPVSTTSLGFVRKATDVEVLLGDPLASEAFLDPYQAKISLDTLSDLAAYTGPQDVVYIKGRASDGDGGQGVWVLTAGDFTAQLATDTLNGVYLEYSGEDGSVRAWVRQVESREYHSGWFGVHTDGTITSTELQAAIDALPVGATLILDAGQINLGTVGILMPNYQVKITSNSGVHEPTVGYSTSRGTNIEYTGTGYAISFGDGTYSSYGCEIENITINGLGIGYGGIRVNGASGGSSYGNKIRNCNILNFTDYGIRAINYCWSNAVYDSGIHNCGTNVSLETNANDWLLTNVDISSSPASDTTIGASLGGGTSDAITITFNGCTFQNLGTGIVTNSNARNVSVFGSYFEDNKLAFDCGSNGFNMYGCSLTGRSGEAYIAKITAGSIDLRGGYTLGSVTDACFHIVAGQGFLHPAARGDSATDFVYFDGGTIHNYANWDLYSGADRRIKYIYSEINRLSPTNPVLRWYNSSGTLMQAVDQTAVLFGRTASGPGNAGAEINPVGYVQVTRDGGTTLSLNRLTSDGDLVIFQRNSSTVGSISVASGVITYGTFCGSHITELDEIDVPIGTILSTTGELINRGRPENSSEYLSKSTISAIKSDPAVYGVYLGNSDSGKAIVASLGTAFVRINKDETPKIGDYIDSNGDGTGKVQTDDILRSSTVAKITSTEVIKVYEDGSYLLACTLHCG